MRVIFVGRLVEKKGVEILIKAFSLASKKFPRADLIIIGDGLLRNNCEALAKRLNILAEFTGLLTTNEIAQLMRTASVLCLPSIEAENGDSEGFGMVLLEAQASGIPVISSALGGSDEGILDGITGFKFPPGDIAALSEHIITLLNDNNITEKMARSARTYVENTFDIREKTQLLEKIYEKIVIKYTGKQENAKKNC